MILAQYKNGNCLVTIYQDGTKHREYDAKPKLEQPESIDLKITNYCDGGCKFCHESSTTAGTHAKVEDIERITSGLLPGTEIAIGGGNPLSHPQLDQILQNFKDRGLISNLTVLQDHAIKGINKLIQLQQNKLLYGIGISGTDAMQYTQEIFGVELENVVLHTIVGVSRVSDVLDAILCSKVLVLGYKQVGFGIQFFDESVIRNQREWFYWRHRLLSDAMSISFDNLALQQLGIKDIVPEEVWTKHYMGDDGQFTMYVDAVFNKYSISSTLKRMPMKDLTAIQAFNLLQKKE